MLRNLHKADLPKVLKIETSVQVVPWTAETFNTCIESGYKGWVIEQDKSLVGFAIASMTKDECHILNLCIDRTYQYQGWGRKLLEYVLNEAREQGVGIAYLEVRRSNTRAIALYRKMHFLQIAERKDYYPTVAGDEDALVFAKRLDKPF